MLYLLSRRGCVSWIFCIFLILSTSAVLANPLQSSADRDLIRERQDRILEEQRKRLEELQRLPGDQTPQAPVETPEDTRCFQIELIKLQGVTLLDAEQQRTLLQPFEHRCLGVNQLNELLQAVTQFYLDRGYVTSRAYLPQQDLSDGDLEVLVVEGTLEGLESSAMASERELAMAFPGRIGTYLNLRELEQLVDQLNRLPSRRAQLELVPGSQVGGSRVQLAGEPLKPWRVGFNRHNDGDSSTGEQQWGTSLQWDSPLGLADQLVLRGGGDTVSDHYRHSSNQSLNYSVPYGWWTFNYSYNQSYYRNQLKGAGFTFKQHGDSKNHAFRAERVLHRDDVSRTALSLGINHLETSNYLDNNRLDVSSHRLTEQQLGFNYGRRIGQAFVNVDLGWQRGSGAFDAQGAGNPKGNQPVSRYNKYSATMSYLQPFQLWGESLSFESLANGQRSEDVLFSPQRISLGGLSSVRGFKDQSLSGDTGGYWRNQLRWRRAIPWTVLQPFVNEWGALIAYDMGVISGDESNGQFHGRMSGQALELSARGPHLAASVTLANSLTRPGVIADSEHPVYFRFDLFF